MSNEKKNIFEHFNENFEKLKNENEEISNLYNNKGKVIEKMEQGKLHDDLFEVRTRNILADIYALEEYNLYPYFRVEHSEKKNCNVIKIYYYKININMEDVNSKSILFLDDRNNYMTDFQDMPMIFQKKNNIFDSLTVIAKDFNYYNDFKFEKKEQKFETSFLLNDFNEDLLKVKTEIKKLQNELDSNNGDDNQKKQLQQKLNSYNDLFHLLEEKFSSENIRHELNVKKNELEILKKKNILDNLRGTKEETEGEYKEKINTLNKEIAKYGNLLKKITITIEKSDQEFDGLFFTSKTIVLTNDIGDELKIPADKPVIVEVKNNNKYKDIIDNISKKKILLESLGIKNFYYIGILNGNVKIDEKKSINKQKKNFDFSRIIIIYPEKMKFLKVPLYEVKKQEKIDEKEVAIKNGQKSEELDLKELILNMEKKMTVLIGTKIDGLRDEMKKEIDGMNTKIDGIRDEMNNKIDGLRNEMNTKINGLTGEINILKEDIKNMKNIN